MVSLERVSCLPPLLTGSNQSCRYQGKTVYLYFKIVESKIKRRPFLYQTNHGAVYYVSEKGVEAAQSWSSEEPIMAFFDCDNANNNSESDLKTFLLKSSVQVIVTTPPSGAYRPWVEQTLGIGDVVFTKLAISLWSAPELFITGLVLAFLLSTLD